jgi:hypothetical protein
MGTLALRLEKLNLDATLRLGVFTTIRQTKDVSGSFPDQPFEEEIAIPVGGTLNRSVEVPEGTYRIEARLPSGEVLRETCTVGPDQEKTEVIFKPNQSPREWLSLQRLAGNVPSQDQYEFWLRNLAAEITDAAVKKQIIPGGSLRIDPEHLTRGAAFLQGLHIRAKPTIDYLASAATTIANRFPSAQRDAQLEQRRAAEQKIAGRPDFRIVERPIETHEAMWEALASFSEWTQWEAQALSCADCVVESERKDSIITLWRIDQKLQGPSGFSTAVRRFAVSNRDQGVDVISIPVPWPLNTNSQPARFEILRDGTSSASKVTVTVSDPEVGGLLLYLSSGRIGEAATILAATEDSAIENLIAGKQLNPLAACAAAYVGLATLPTNASPRWLAWLANVNKWFPWLPDGAIVHAMYLMKTANTETDLNIASETFISAYKRGVPYYSAGIQQLLQGLYVFRSRDRKIDEMYRKVNAVALRVDPDQAFTVVRLLG